MNLQTVEIPRGEARESYVEYRRAAHTESDPAARRELEEMARAFRLAAQEDVALIALTPTIARGGTVTRTIVHAKGTAHERRTHFALPRLAVAPADAQFVFTLGVEHDGSITFIDRLRTSPRYTSGVIHLEAGFEIPVAHEPANRIDSAWTTSGWSAQVPIVPPKHRPGRVRSTGGLRPYRILWEVDDWRWRVDPTPSRDPALLRHVGGDIYAVLATWDLSELERLVLSGRRLPTR
jgi:hypothetical protein